MFTVSLMIEVETAFGVGAIVVDSTFTCDLAEQRSAFLIFLSFCIFQGRNKEFLSKTIEIEDKDKMFEKEIGVGAARIAGYVADAASLSSKVVHFAAEKSSCAADELNKFAAAELQTLEGIRDAAGSCTAISDLLKGAKLSFFDEIYDILESVMEEMQPFVEMIEDILDTIASLPVRLACCGTPPMRQDAVRSVRAISDLTTCFAGPIERLLDDLLRVSHYSYYRVHHQRFFH